MQRIRLRLPAAILLVILPVGVTVPLHAADPRADFAFCNGTEPRTLDPQTMTGVLEGRIGAALFEGLTYRDHDTLLPVPGSASSWDVSPDGRRYVFHMRKDARWSHGSPVTANDFVYAWKRLQAPETGAEFAYLFHAIRHAEAFNTYAANVTALRGDPTSESLVSRQGIIDGLRTLLRVEPQGIPAATWQEFAARRAIRDAVVRTSERVIVESFDRREGRFTPEEGLALVAGFEAEATRREVALTAAKARFGVDEGIYAPDPTTFVVELVSFVPYFLELTSSFAALPVARSAVDARPLDWFRTPETLVGNGPFQLDAWEKDRVIRLRKSETYWGREAVQLRTVDILSTANTETAWTLYQAGDVDWLPGNHPPDLIDVLRRRTDFHQTPSISTYFYRINTTRKPFDDARVRLALSKSIDRALLVKTITRKGEPIGRTVVPAGIGGGYEPPESRMDFDPEAARLELSKAGYPEGKGFPEFTLLYNTSEGHRKYAEFVTSQWRAHLNIHAAAMNLEWKRYLEKQTALDFVVCRAGWVADYNDPGTFLDMWVTKGGNNNTGWGDPFYDRLVHLAADPFRVLEDPDAVLSRCKERSRMDERLQRLRAAPAGGERLAAAKALRFQLFREAEAVLIQDAFPIIPLFSYVNSNLVSPRLRNFRTRLLRPDGTSVDNLEDLHPFRDLVVEPRAGAGR